MLSLRTINAMTETEFVESFQGIYERSPWVPSRAFCFCPFTTSESLLKALHDTIDQATSAEQDTLIQAHPDLAGKLARAGQLTEASTREQNRLGLDQLNETEFAKFDSLNQTYQSRFGFPFIICVGLLQDRSQILDAFQSRLNHSPEEERQEALKQIHLIAKLRFTALVEDIPSS